MFWGLIMESGKRYTQKVEKSFHISKACLDPVSSGNEPVSVYVETDNKKFLICVLQKAVTVQSSLDLNFMLGDKIAFFIVGKGTVHVTGYLHDTEEDLDDAVLSEEESEEEEIIEEAKKEKSKKRKDQPQPTKQNAKKVKIEEEDSDDDEDDSDVDLSDLVGEEEEDDDEDEEMDEDEVEEDEDDDDEDESDEVPQPVETPPQKKSKKQKKKEKEQQKLAQSQSPAQDGKDKKAAGGVTPKPQTPQVNGTPNAQQSGKKDKKKKGGETPAGAVGTPKNQQQSPQAGDKQQTPQKRTLEGGVAVEELKVGNGAPAKPGKLVTVYYTGRLKQNNKQFDATNQGPGFKFRLGKGEVIKGWDIGLNGMKVGGKRRIVIPPHMAYGAKGSPPVIPPNSALVFEVELRNVN